MLLLCVSAKKHTWISQNKLVWLSSMCTRCSSEDGDKKVNKIYLARENAGQSKSLFNIYILYVHIYVYEYAVKYRLLGAIFFSIYVIIIYKTSFPSSNFPSKIPPQALSLSLSLPLIYSPFSHPKSECYRILHYIILLLYYILDDWNCTSNWVIPHNCREYV